MYPRSRLRQMLSRSLPHAAATLLAVDGVPVKVTSVWLSNGNGNGNRDSSRGRELNLTLCPSEGVRALGLDQPT